MITDWVPAQISFDLDGRRLLDTARGLLMGLRRCPSETASRELLSAAERHKVPVLAMAWALVHLTDDNGRFPHTFTDAQAAARHEWGHLFAESAVSTC